MSWIRLALLSLCLVTWPAHAKVRVGEKFPTFRLPFIMSGKTFDSKAINGKMAVIDIWGADCHPCRHAIPELNILYKQMDSKTFALVGINVYEDDAATKRFLEEFKVEYTLVNDPAHEFVKGLGVTEMPTTYILDSKGIVRYINKGFKSNDIKVIEAELRKLIKPSRKKIPPKPRT